MFFFRINPHRYQTLIPLIILHEKKTIRVFIYIGFLLFFLAFVGKHLCKRRPFLVTRASNETQQRGD